MGAPPRVTIGVPVFRGEAFVAETLQSIQAQTCGDFMVLISVDGGDESSAEICRAFEADPRFSVFVQPERLLWTGNVNWLVDRSTTEFFVYLAQDDLFHPQYIETLIAHADSRPEAAVVYSDLQWFGDLQLLKNEPEFPGTARERVLAQLRACHWTAFRGLRRMALTGKAAPLNADSAFNFFEDVLWVTDILKAGPAVHVAQPLLLKRHHAGSIGNSWKSWSRREIHRAWINTWTRVLAAALPVATDEKCARQMLQIMLRRVALDAGEFEWIAKVADRTTTERPAMAVDLIDHIERQSIDLPEMLHIDWPEIRRWAIAFIQKAGRTRAG